MRLTSGSASCPRTDKWRTRSYGTGGRTGSPSTASSSRSDRPSHQRANKPNRRGMFMRGQGIPTSLARPERASTRHPTLNTGLGMKFLHLPNHRHERILGRAAWRARIVANKNRSEISRFSRLSARFNPIYPLSGFMCFMRKGGDLLFGRHLPLFSVVTIL